MFWPALRAVAIVMARLAFAGACCFIVFHRVDFLQRLRLSRAGHQPMASFAWDGDFAFLLPGCFSRPEPHYKAPFIIILLSTAWSIESSIKVPVLPNHGFQRREAERCVRMVRAAPLPGNLVSDRVGAGKLPSLFGFAEQFLRGNNIATNAIRYRLVKVDRCGPVIGPAPNADIEDAAMQSPDQFVFALATFFTH